jgi:hypothetical protein
MRVIVGVSAQPQGNDDQAQPTLTLAPATAPERRLRDAPTRRSAWGTTELVGGRSGCSFCARGQLGGFVGLKHEFRASKKCLCPLPNGVAMITPASLWCR